VTPPDGVVDLVLTGGTIVTMAEPGNAGVEAKAMAIDGNVIVAVGARDEVLALVSEDTAVLDLDGRVVFPGFIDAHSHWYQPNRLGDYGPEQINQVLLSRGWTGTNDVNIEPHLADQFFDWHEDGRIALRMNAYLSVNTPSANQERYGNWFEEYGLAPGSSIGERLRIPGVKIFVASDWDRVQKWTPEELRAAVIEYHDAGWQIAVKQLSDDVLDLALGAFDGITTAEDDRRHRLEHALEIRADQIEQVRALGLVPIVQLGAIEADFSLEEGFAETISDEGFEAIWPFRTLFDESLPVTGSIAVSPLEGLRSPFTISVAQMLHGALTGVSEVGNEPWPDRAEELMTVDQALESITWRAAWATFEEDERGSLRPGLLADFVVLSADPRSAQTDPEFLRALTVDATVIDGALLWCGFGLDEWCAFFGQAIPERLLEESTLEPLREGDLGTSGDQPTVTGAISASSFDPAFPPEQAFDGRRDLGGWLAAGPAPGWIEVDLGSAMRVTQVRLTVDQDPAGPTHHRILGGPAPAPSDLLADLAGDTTWGQELVADGDWTIRYLRVETLASTPAYGWLEIEVVTAD
jgi:predicted amidohydrolase YtcJ